MNRKELHKLCSTPDWRWATPEGAELHTLLLGLLCTFREKLEWLEAAETLALQLRSRRKKSAGRSQDLLDVEKLRKLQPHRKKP
jgi:hypothetical protein